LKGTLIANILARVKTIHSSMIQVEAVKKKMTTTGTKGIGELHIFYKS
jgi:hypothetical protein